MLAWSAASHLAACTVRYAAPVLDMQAPTTLGKVQSVFPCSSVQALANSLGIAGSLMCSRRSSL